MSRCFFDLAFTPAVKAQQERQGTRAAYAAAAARAASDAALSARETAFIAERDTFFLASVSETGWPYVQHRGGPVGFVRHLDQATIGWAEFAGNGQYVTAGNATRDDRVAMVFIDFARRKRLKLLGHLREHEPRDRPDLAIRLDVDGYRAEIERLAVVTVEAYDWNCPQHIVPRFALAEVEAIVAPLRARIAELEARMPANEPVLVQS